MRKESKTIGKIVLKRFFCLGEHIADVKMQRRKNMNTAKEELIREIEKARKALNESIDLQENYEVIYDNSVMLDKLIEQYLVSEY